MAGVSALDATCTSFASIKTNGAKTLFFLIAVLLTSCSVAQPSIYQTPAAKDYCADVVKPKNKPLAHYLTPFSRQMATQTGIYVLEEDAESMLTRAWLTEHAKTSIDIQYFIFSTDNIGLIATDYLVKAAERGVKVRMLVDDIMIEAKGSELLVLAAHPNIEIKVYNPLANIGKNIVQKLYNLTTRFHDFNQRMHNKTFTVDGQVTITGGRNIADEYFGYDHQYNFRDRDVLMLGGVVANVEQSFDQFWQSELSVDVNKLATRQQKKPITADFERLHQYACNPENFVSSIRQKISDLPKTFVEIERSGQLHWLNDVEYISDIPGKNTANKFLAGGGATTSRLLELVQQAKSSITIQTPYLVTTKDVRKVFKALVERGVEIKILTNSLASNDNLEAFSGYQRDRKALLNTGVEIYEFKPDAAIREKIMSQVLDKKLADSPIFGLHAKSMVIDDEIAVIGTFNLDPRSIHLNTESITVIPSIEVAKSVKQGMLEEMQPENAWRISKDFNPDSEVSAIKRLKVKLRRIVPKSIL